MNFFLYYERILKKDCIDSNKIMGASQLKFRQSPE